MKRSEYQLSFLIIALTVITAGFMVRANTIGYWRIEDGTAGTDISSTADSSGNGYAATQWGSNVSAVQYSSNVGAAYVYDPVAGTYSANTGSMLATGTTSTDNSMLLIDSKAAMSGSFTLEMFLKIENGAGGAADFTGSTSARVFQLDGSPSCNGTIGASSGGTTYLNYSNTGGSYYGSNFEDGAWHHIAYVADYNGVDTTTFSLYVDGTSVASSTYSGEFSAANWQDFRFGLANSTMSNLEWYFDEVRLSDTALTNEQFLQLEAVPEPASIALIALGCLAMIGVRKLHA